MIPFRFWHISGICAPIIFGGMFARVLFSTNPVAQVIGFACSVVLFVLCGVGAYLGVKRIFGPVLMKCPFCVGAGEVGYSKKEGLYLICDHCGFIHGVGPLKAKLVCEQIPDDEEKPSQSPEPTAPSGRGSS